MADRAGPRLQGDSVDHHFPWPEQDFCQMFLDDFTQFIRDPNTKLSAVPPRNYFLPHEVGESLRNRISEYVSEYLNHHTHSTRDKPGHYPIAMERYMAQNDDPWGASRMLAQKTSQIPNLPTTNPESPGLLGPRDSIHRAARDVAELSWPLETDLGVTVVATTREKSHNTYLEKTVESIGRVIKQGGVVGLSHAGLSSRSDVRSRSGSGVENTDLKQRGSSSYYEGYTSPRLPEVKRRRNGSFTNNKGLSVGQLARSHRHSGGSKASNSGKQHKCPDCPEVFPFEARLKSHQAVHNKQKCRCNNCGSEFGRDSSLKRHQITPNACQKKREARLRQTSFQSAVGIRPESQNYFEADATTSMTSRSSYRESDCVSVDNSPHDTRYPPRFQPGSGLMISDHGPTSPRSHGQSYAYRNERIIGPNYSQISHMGGHNFPPRNTQTQQILWDGIDPVLWPTENDASNRGDFGCHEYLSFPADE